MNPNASGTQSRVIVFTLPAPAAPLRQRTTAGRLPRIARLMALALRFEDLLGTGTVKDCAELARLGRVSRARVSQIMNLLNLAPDIQERLLFLTPVKTWRDELNERALRGVLQEALWTRQRVLFARLLPSGEPGSRIKPSKAAERNTRADMPMRSASRRSLCPAARC